MTGALAASIAEAYVRVRPVGERATARWTTNTITMSLDHRALPDGLERRHALATLQRAADKWNAAAALCSDLRIAIGETGGSRVGDGRSGITFLSKRFCRDGVDRAGNCYDPRIASLTTLQFGQRLSSNERAIVEADVELNAVTFAWSAGTEAAQSRAGKPVMELEAAFLHELGHVLGFGHVCERGPRARIVKDHAGQRVLSCSDAPKHVVSSIMAPGGDAVWGGLWLPPSDLGADERAGLCAVYGRASSDAHGDPHKTARVLGLAGGLLILASGLFWAFRRSSRLRAAPIGQRDSPEPR